MTALNICYDLEDYNENGKKGRKRYQEVIDMLFFDKKWHNALKLVVEYMVAINNNICNPIDMIFYMINSSHGDRFNENAIECDIMASECLASLEIDLASDETNECRSLCQSRLVEILNNPKATYENKIRATRALSVLGDTRFDDYMIVPEMVDVTAGTFIKGADESEIKEFIEESSKVDVSVEWYKTYWREVLASEILQKKQVEISKNYRMSKYPITNLQYKAFIDDCPEYVPPRAKYDSGEIEDDDIEIGVLYSWDLEKRSCHSAYNNCPVVLVSWNDANNYCKWLSKKTGRKFRLPTEDEWEYAARGPSSKKYPWGEEWKNEITNTVELEENDIIGVGCFSNGKSDFGLYDCAGQAWEWTLTQDNALWERARASQIPENEQAYIVKGGAWDDIFVFSRGSARGPNVESLCTYYIGFRILEELE